MVQGKERKGGRDGGRERWREGKYTRVGAVYDKRFQTPTRQCSCAKKKTTNARVRILVCKCRTLCHITFLHHLECVGVVILTKFITGVWKEKRREECKMRIKRLKET